VTQRATERIAVVGAGQMGNGIAHTAALHGISVTLIDVSVEVLARARATIGSNLERQVKKGTATAEARDAALAAITTATDLGAAGEATLVVEAASEDAALKFRLFGDLDRATGPSTILASNTSSISITDIGAHTARPDRVIGMHFMNPVPVMRLVEVIRGLATSDETTATVTSLATRLGKTPVEVSDYPGFVSNRVLMPMINEAAYCVMEGVGTPQAVDTIMTLGMNHPMGPLALADLIGLDTCVSVLDVLRTGLGDPKYRACPLLRKYVAAGWLGRKTKRGFYTYD
jgi:3-hydroxybutyryl-CoA dehydrogenase